MYYYKKLYVYKGEGNKKLGETMKENLEEYKSSISCFEW